jgi:hypothetical protein
LADGRGARQGKETALTRAEFQAITTVPELARYLGMGESTVRAHLRRVFPDRAPGKGKPWKLDPQMHSDLWFDLYGWRPW